MIKNLDAEIAELEIKLAKLNEKKKKFESLSPKIKVAEVLHEYLCFSNHVDGCSWGYESWNNPGHDRQRYLRKAEAAIEVMKVFNFEDKDIIPFIEEFLEAVS